jgi:hypothetical protein
MSGVTPIAAMAPLQRLLRRIHRRSTACASLERISLSAIVRPWSARALPNQFQRLRRASRKFVEIDRHARPSPRGIDDMRDDD